MSKYVINYLFRISTSRMTHWVQNVWRNYSERSDSATLLCLRHTVAMIIELESAASRSWTRGPLASYASVLPLGQYLFSFCVTICHKPHTVTTKHLYWLQARAQHFITCQYVRKYSLTNTDKDLLDRCLSVFVKFHFPIHTDNVLAYTYIANNLHKKRFIAYEARRIAVIIFRRASGNFAETCSYWNTEHSAYMERLKF